MLTQAGSRASRLAVPGTPLPPSGRGVRGEGTALRRDMSLEIKLEWRQP
jgi:hypothetical protein